MNFRLFIERYGGATNKIMYHGTTDAVLNNIMSVGLIPNAKKSWVNDPGNFYHASKDSLPGIYVTDNLLTAMGAARSTVESLGGKNRIIVIMSLQPRTFYGDEDSVTFTTSKLWHPKLEPNEWLTREIYTAWLKDPNSEMVEEFKNHYIQGTLDMFELKFGEMNPNLVYRLRLLLGSCFLAALKRKAAYTDPGWADEHRWKIDPKEAEMEYRHYMDQLTKTLRSLISRPDKGMGSINYTARVTEPVRFTGKNKIICIVEIIKGEDRRENVKVIYGELPDKFKTDWTERIGELNVI